MTIQIELPANQELRLRDAATHAGVSVDELVRQAIDARLSTPEREDDGLALIESWIADAPTDPDAIREAEADLLEFQRAMNETRRSAGARVPYPDVD